MLCTLTLRSSQSDYEMIVSCHWDGVKLYPLMAELSVYILLMMSFWHAVRSVTGTRGWHRLSMWLSLVVLACSWELWSACWAPKWHPVCYPKSLLMIRNCHNMWGSLRHVPLGYASWAIGRHERYAARGPSFMACFLFLLFSLSFECFALANNLLRYNHKVDALGPTVFFRVPALVVALYAGAALCMLQPTALHRQKHRRSWQLLRGLLGVVGTAVVVALGGVLMAAGAMKLGQHADVYWKQKQQEQQQEQEQEQEQEALDDDPEDEQQHAWPQPPAQASLCAIVPALVLGLLLLYFACFFLLPPPRPAGWRCSSLQPDYLLFCLPLFFFLALDGAALLRALGLDGTQHDGEGAPDDLSNLHVELSAPARLFLALNSVLALWACAGGCSILPAPAPPTPDGGRSVSLDNYRKDDFNDSGDEDHESDKDEEHLSDNALDGRGAVCDELSPLERHHHQD